jgi:hypothetical protein
MAGGAAYTFREADEAALAELIRLQPGKVFVVGLQAVVTDQIRAAFPELDAAQG